EAVFRDLLEKEGLSSEIEVDSAGTGSWHLGSPADERSQAAATRHGLRLLHRARQIRVLDLDEFDYIVAMDNENLSQLRKLATNASQRNKIKLFRDWDPAGPGEIPDPFYGGEADFEAVWHLCDRSARGLLEELRKKT
ncbi:MAG: low molecular weight phosphotyrosine protein phosphatase, partial [Spirochaetales bacterium]|nr:low molecular weight phosphotyrosine protein phosphatase [Spirochaetales bacterium]